MPPLRAFVLPGVVLPAELAYAALLAALGPGVDAVAKDLELYATTKPADDYGLETEVAGLLREADARGWERFHLVGYSGGGAVALACAASAADRVSSLALVDAAWAGTWDLSAAERRAWLELERIEELPDAEFMGAFVRLSVRPGVALPEPPPGDPPPWLAKRPAGMRAFLRAFRRGEIDRERLRRFDRPVYVALGGLSNPDQYREIAERLGRVFPDFTLEVFDERHHFDPPHRLEPERLAESLAAHWRRAGA